MHKDEYAQEFAEVIKLKRDKLIPIIKKYLDQ
jgi:hypothetical protein